MGVIKSQSIYATLLSYVGVVIGFVTSALVLPKILTPDQLGLTKLIVAVTGVFAGVFSFGVAQLLFRAYPMFSDDTNKLAKLFYLSIKIAFFGSLVALPFYYFTTFDLFNVTEPVHDFSKSHFFLFAVFVVIAFRILYLSLFGYVRMSGKIVIDTFIQNIFLKAGILLIALLFIFEIVTFTGLVYAQMLLYLFFPLIIILYLINKKSLPKIPRGVSFSRLEKKEFFQLSLFGTMTTVGSSLYLYLDTLMVNHYLGEAEVGIYGTLYLFGIIVIVPARGLKSVAVSILSKSFKDERLEEIEKIYKKSSAVLLVVGGYIFLGVYLNLYSVFAYLPDEFAVGGTIVLLIGLAQITDMACGVNYEVIASSKHYKLNTWFIFLGALTGIAFNIIFIPIWGVNGAAFATFASLSLINFARIIAVWKLFGIQPFSSETLKTFLLMGAVFAIVSFIPNHDNYILNLLFKSALITILYLPTAYYLKLSEDLNDMINKTLKRF